MAVDSVIPTKTRVAVVGFSVQRERPVANKKFDTPNSAAAYLLEILLRDSVDFVSIRKIKQAVMT